MRIIIFYITASNVNHLFVKKIMDTFVATGWVLNEKHHEFDEKALEGH